MVVNRKATPAEFAHIMAYKAATNKLIKTGRLSPGDYIQCKINIRNYAETRMIIKDEAKDLQGQILVLKVIRQFPRDHLQYPGEIALAFPQHIRDKTNLRNIASGDVIFGEKVNVKVRKVL